MSPITAKLTDVLILADLDFRVIIILIFAVIGFIKWIISQANQAKNVPPQQPRAQQPRHAQPQLAREIEMFLQEVGDQKKPAQRAQAVEIEVVSDDEIRRRRVRRVPVPAQPPRRAEQRTPPRKLTRPGGEIEKRERPGSKELGAKLQDHLQKYMQSDRVEREVEKHLSHQVSQSVEQHLGAFTAERGAMAAPAAPFVPDASALAIRALVARLRDPQGMRDAILINEILTRPTGRRRHI